MRDVVTSSKVVAGAAAFSLFSFVLHKLHSVHKLLSTPAFLVCYCLCQALQLLVPSLVVFASRMAPLFAAVTEMQLVVLAMKAHSYFATNYALLRERGFKRPLGHITLGDYLYYLLAPTLVYEPRFPRTAAIRPRYVGKKLAQAAVAMLAQYCTMAQFMLPVLRRPSGGALYDMMKLAVPSFIVWLLGFYALFHCLLNAIAELLRFADRQFYLDWCAARRHAALPGTAARADGPGVCACACVRACRRWNTTSLDSFWRKWNTPVHEWCAACCRHATTCGARIAPPPAPHTCPACLPRCLRHVYVESMHYYKVSKTTATTGVFLMSALLHEVIIFVGFRTLRPWFFVGMIVQARAPPRAARPALPTAPATPAAAPSPPAPPPLRCSCRSSCSAATSEATGAGTTSCGGACSWGIRCWRSCTSVSGTRTTTPSTAPPDPTQLQPCVLADWPSHTLFCIPPRTTVRTLLRLDQTNATDTQSAQRRTASAARPSIAGHRSGSQPPRAQESGAVRPSAMFRARGWPCPAAAACPCCRSTPACRGCRPSAGRR